MIQGKERRNDRVEKVDAIELGSRKKERRESVLGVVAVVTTDPL